MLDDITLARIQSALGDAGLDGWLLFDFRRTNPIAASLMGMRGLVSRRWFVFIPRSGKPTAVTHAIEQGPWEEWPSSWPRRVYSGWRDLERELADLVGGKRVAMEYSPGNAVPYVDRAPAGLLDMVRAAGATVSTSADLVTRFYAVWSAENLASHERAAAHLARIARNALALAGERAKAGTPMREAELAELIRREFADVGLSTDHGPNVSIGPNAANPHYEPDETHSAEITSGSILLIDLWAREEGGVYADQTWMGSLGTPSERDRAVWEAIRDARDAAIALLRSRVRAGETVRGNEVDAAARAVIVERGFGDYLLHRTGHSIDARDLHGSGPNLDDVETRDERALLPGVGFSIEPGIYIASTVGMRTEVNAIVQDRDVLITPDDPQHDLLIV